MTEFCEWQDLYIDIPDLLLILIRISRILAYSVSMVSISLYLKAQQDFLKKKKDLEAKHEEQLVSMMDIFFKLGW